VRLFKGIRSWGVVSVMFASNHMCAANCDFDPRFVKRAIEPRAPRLQCPPRECGTYPVPADHLDAFHMFKNSVLTLAALLILAAAAARADTLSAIKKRGYLACGSNPGRAGFGLPDGQGHWTGLDADFCRALAAAIFDDAGKVKFVPLTAKD